MIVNISDVCVKNPLNASKITIKILMYYVLKALTYKEVDNCMFITGKVNASQNLIRVKIYWSQIS